MDNILEKITDEAVRKEVVRVIEERDSAKQELELSNKTAKSLKDRNEKLEVINTDLYAKVISGRATEKQEVKEITLDEATDNIVKKLRTKL